MDKFGLPKVGEFGILGDRGEFELGDPSIFKYFKK